MKKSFMNNIKNFVDSNVRQRIDRVANNNNDFFGDDLLLVERQFEDIRQICVEADKRISALLLSLSHSSPSLGVHSSTSNLSTINSSSTATIFGSNEAQSTSNPSNTYTGSSDKQSSFKSSATHTHSILESQALANSFTNNISNNLLLQSSNNINNANDATELHNNDIRRFKKLPIVGFLKFLVKSRSKSKPGSLLTVTLTHCSQLQTQLTQLYLTYERTIETQCLKPLRQTLEIDVPNVIKLRKLFIKSHNDLESVKAKYNGASLKQQQSQTSHFTSTSYTIQQSSVHQSNINKLDQLKKELDEAVTRFEQAGDNYATELYTFVCRETELVNLFIRFYQHQAEYQLQVSEAISNSLPTLSNTLANTPRKAVFGIVLEEHLRSTGRSLALVIELCLHLLYSKALNEEGLFRIPGSSIKIKKLKSAIDAWFVTLASQDELNNNQQGSRSSVGCKTTLFAIHDLFKDIAGLTQIPHNTTTTTLHVSETLPNKPMMTARDDSTLTHSSVITPTPLSSTTSTTTTTTSTVNHNQQSLVFDVHTIAGLLKLYLRELPEPLFSDALYQQWIDAAVKTMSSKQLVAFEQVIQQLPGTHYDNLRLLIRFLHLLTLHSDSNKMTATNLAITMAPSLIWAPNTQRLMNRDQKLSPLSSDQQQQEDLNLQMSTVGISASLHALVIENLIINAESLFPGSIQFRIAELDQVFDLADTNDSSKQDRSLKSSSPTGLSTASSSSFSSSSNASATSSSTNKSHSRRGGSIDGLIDDELKTKQQRSKQGRPASVHIQRSSSQHHQVPPPLPPAPVSRSHIRQNTDSSAQPSRQTSSPYPSKPAPPLPPPSSYRQQSSRPSPPPPTMNLTICTDNSSLPPVAASCRGTGKISAAPSPTYSTTRPTVPPPNRPSKVQTRNDGTAQTGVFVAGSSKATTEDVDSRSSHSVASSGNLRTDFEEVNAIDVDDIDISVPSVSPVVSFDSMSDDDIDYDNQSRSLEHSWTECDLDQNQVQDRASKSATKADSRKSKLNTSQQSSSTSPNGEPPVKPPRCISPKITQSTPL